jgi:hypothetical protein
MIISVIIRATGRVTKRLKKNLEAIPEKHTIDSYKDSYTWYITHNMESTKIMKN